jgi:hypothetical protein
MIRLAGAICALMLLVNAPASAQEGGPAADGFVRFLIDCSGAPCDHDFFRTEITFVDFVRQRQDADVHLLITGEPTGQGGRELTYTFFGQGRFRGQDHLLRSTFRVAESDDAVRREMVRVVSLGLVPYATQSAAIDRLAVSMERSPPEANAVQPATDPWDRWTFRIGMQGNAGGERSSRSAFINSSVNANRTTVDLKLNVSSFFSYRHTRFELPDGRRFLSPNREHGLNGLIARSLSGHWSAGTRLQYYSSTFSNQRSAWYVAPAIEYDIFPYADSTRRLLTLHYAAGVRGFQYERETIFGKLTELRAAHVLSVVASARQRWGNINGRFDALSYIPAFDQNNFTGFGSVNLNIVRGLSLNLNGQMSWINDQIYLPRQEATSEEVLVRQRQLATSYRYNMFFGVSYTFGSPFSSVVNPRFGSGGF